MSLGKGGDHISRCSRGIAGVCGKLYFCMNRIGEHAFHSLITFFDLQQ
jgi:hypothetical protein